MDYFKEGFEKTANILAKNIGRGIGGRFGKPMLGRPKMKMKKMEMKPMLSGSNRNRNLKAIDKMKNKLRSPLGRLKGKINELRGR
jgi:hypothetical protein